jgi:hypothetical protein
MTRRTWDAHTKAMIVREGVKGKPVAERCTEQQISQSLSDQGRDPRSPPSGGASI